MLIRYTSNNSNQEVTHEMLSEKLKDAVLDDLMRPNGFTFNTAWGIGVAKYAHALVDTDITIEVSPTCSFCDFIFAIMDSPDYLNFVRALKERPRFGLENSEPYMMEDAIKLLITVFKSLVVPDTHWVCVQGICL